MSWRVAKPTGSTWIALQRSSPWRTPPDPESGRLSSSRAVGAAGARLPDTEKVTGSNPVRPTRLKREIEYRRQPLGPFRRVQRPLTPSLGRSASQSCTTGRWHRRPAHGVGAVALAVQDADGTAGLGNVGRLEVSASWMRRPVR